MSQGNAPIELLSLLSSLMGGSANTVFIEVTPKEGQSMEDAIAEAEAKHRASCVGCAAEYEARQAMQAAAEPSKGGAAARAKEAFDAQREKLAAAQREADDTIKNGVAKDRTNFAPVAAVIVAQAGIDHFIVQVPPGSAVKVGTDLFDVPQLPTGEEPKRQPIGYMAFSLKDGEMAPIGGSFHTDRSAVEKKLAMFNALPELDMVRRLAKFIGKDAMRAEVRPVFAD